jgi:uncharacterized membrane protein
MASERTTFASDFRRFFVRGLAILLPSVLTLWIVWQAYLFVDRQVAEPINRGLRQAVLAVLPRTLSEGQMPEWFVVSDDQERIFRTSVATQGSLESQALLRRSTQELKAELRARQFKQFWDSHWYFRFIGLFVAVTLIYLAGVILGGFLGRRLYVHFERLMTRVPIFKQVYPHVKQVVEMIFGEKQLAFNRVVLVEYPRKGTWSVGFVTSQGFKDISQVAGEPVLSVYIPSTPTAFTGFVVVVTRSQALDLPISIDEAIRFVLTGGVLVPASQATVPPDTIAPRADAPGGALSGPVETTAPAGAHGRLARPADGRAGE